jgi:hypothetical protein
MGELVLWYGMFAPKGRLKWDHGLGRGAPFHIGERMEVRDQKRVWVSTFCGIDEDLFSRSFPKFQGFNDRAIGYLLVFAIEN